MKIGLDGNTVFNEYLEYKANDIMDAFEGNNSEIPTRSISYEWQIGRSGKDRHKVLVDGVEDNSMNRTGLYIYSRNDSLDSKRSFVYCGVTAKIGFLQRFVKVCRHALNNISPGDTVIPFSKYLRTVCKGDLDDIRVCFVPMDIPHAELKDLERLVIKKLRAKYGWQVRNVSDGEKAPEVIDKDYLELPF